jgi:hypothetical protein
VRDFTSEFATAARIALSFLQSDHGFREDSLETPRDLESVYATYAMTYTRKVGDWPPQTVRLSKTPARGELFLECTNGELADPDRTVDARDLLAIAQPGARVVFANAVSDAFGKPSLMAEQYRTLGSLLQAHGSRFFDRDETLWGDVRRMREERRQQYDCLSEQRAWQRTLHESEIAFKNRQWRRVVDFLDGRNGTLTKAQSTRLSYARKQLEHKD